MDVLSERFGCFGLLLFNVGYAFALSFASYNLYPNIP